MNSPDVPVAVVVLAVSLTCPLTSSSFFCWLLCHCGESGSSLGPNRKQKCSPVRYPARNYPFSFFSSLRVPKYSLVFWFSTLKGRIRIRFVGALNRRGQDWNTLLETATAKQHSFWMGKSDKSFFCLFINWNCYYGQQNLTLIKISLTEAIFSLSSVCCSIGAKWQETCSQKLALMAQKVLFCPPLKYRPDPPHL